MGSAREFFSLRSLRLCVRTFKRNFTLRILILNGANINFLGKREPDIYGGTTYTKLSEEIIKKAEELNISVEIFQSNSEGELIDKIQSSFGKTDFIIVNPGAYTHTSIALRDAFLSVKIPFIEVHISNIFKREAFRHKSYFSDISVGTITGFGTYSYILALYAAKNYFNHD